MSSAYASNPKTNTANSRLGMKIFIIQYRRLRTFWFFLLNREFRLFIKFIITLYLNIIVSGDIAYATLQYFYLQLNCVFYDLTPCCDSSLDLRLTRYYPNLAQPEIFNKCLKSIYIKLLIIMLYMQSCNFN